MNLTCFNDCYFHPRASGVARIFSGGGGPGHLKASTPPPSGCPGAKGPWTVAKFHFLKRFKVLENESFFQKYQHFSCPKNPFFLRNISKIEQIYKNFCVFSKNYLKIWIFFWRDCIYPEKFPMNSIIYLRNLSKNLKNGFDREGLLEMGW